MYKWRICQYNKNLSKHETKSNTAINTNLINYKEMNPRTYSLLQEIN